MNFKCLTILGLLFLNMSYAQAATLEQSIQFKNTSPERIYEIYMSSPEHSAFTGAPANIDAREGGQMSIFGGHGVGQFLKLVPGRLIVQSWRAKMFQPNDLDSTLILTFRKTDTGAEIEMVQVNVPDSFKELIGSSWNENYWQPLAEYVKIHPDSVSH